MANTINLWFLNNLVWLHKSLMISFLYGTTGLIYSALGKEVFSVWSNRKEQCENVNFD